MSAPSHRGPASSTLPIGRVLGRLLVLTDRHACAGPLEDVVRDAVRGGARAVVLRERDLPGAARAALAGRLQPILSEAGGQLILAGPGRAVDRGDEPEGAVAAAGLHLAAADVAPEPRPALLGRSCHDAAELAAAAGLDWVTLSPVWLTASKPGYGPALGLERLAELVARTTTPVYALGGVTGPEQARSCRVAGAVGVAVLGAVMTAADPARVVAGLLAALDGPP